MSNTTLIPQLQLHSHQVQHFRRIVDILTRFRFYIDGSEMGTGKTYIAAAIAIYFQIPCLVLCGSTAKAVWQDVFQTYGVRTYDLPGTASGEMPGIITYDSLRSRKGSQPKNGLLVRDDTGEGVQFYPTTMFSEIVRAGVLLIVDECQAIKNNSDRNKAVKALMRQFYVHNSNSRAAFLSGSPLDKEEHALNFLRAVGLITHRNLYTKVRGQVRLEGVEELHEWGRRIGAENTQRFIDTHNFPSTQKGSKEYVFNFFVEVIRPGVMSIMPRQETGAIKDVKNGFYYFSYPEDELEYRKAIAELQDATRYREDTGTVVTDKENMGAVTNALVHLQQSKVTDMIRVARETLNRTIIDAQGNILTPKVILFSDYYDENIDRLMEELAEFQPQEVTGRVSVKKRAENIARFQQPDAQYRLLIGNPLVGGQAISLHDTTGLFPRFQFTMPGYRVNEAHQSTGRTFRTGTIGTATIRFFFGISGRRETNILAALMRKGSVMRRTVQEQSEYGVLFPDEYEDDIEEIPEGVQAVRDDVESVSGPVNYFVPQGDFDRTRQRIEETAQSMRGLTLGEMPASQSTSPSAPPSQGQAGSRPTTPH